MNYFKKRVKDLNKRIFLFMLVLNIYYDFVKLY